MRFLNYQQIMWSETRDEVDYQFNPEFLQPYKSILRDQEFSFHLTQKGDIVIMDRFGLLASYRKGGWHLYDTPTFKNTIADILGSYRVGCNSFDILFDLSYRRHGALLIYDPEHTTLSHVINAGSIIKEGFGTPDLAHQMLKQAISPIQMGNARSESRKKRLFLELASMDGAIIFDDTEVLAFGSMIELHPSASGHAGARTTAAHSAYHWGGRSMKVSSDGDISILFKSHSATGSEEDATLSFM